MLVKPPYGHNGALASLDEVISYYDNPPQNIPLGTRWTPYKNYL